MTEADTRVSDRSVSKSNIWHPDPFSIYSVSVKILWAITLSCLYDSSIQRVTLSITELLVEGWLLSGSLPAYSCDFQLQQIYRSVRPKNTNMSQTTSDSLTSYIQ